MAVRVNPEWLKSRKEEIREYRSVDVTTTFNKAVQALIILLVEANLPFKLYNLGAGVKRITTETNICPYCKRKL